MVPPMKEPRIKDHEGLNCGEFFSYTISLWPLTEQPLIWTLEVKEGEGRDKEGVHTD